MKLTKRNLLPLTNPINIRTLLLRCYMLLPFYKASLISSLSVLSDPSFLLNQTFLHPLYLSLPSSFSHWTLPCHGVGHSSTSHLLPLHTHFYYCYNLYSCSIVTTTLLVLLLLALVLWLCYFYPLIASHLNTITTTHCNCVHHTTTTSEAQVSHSAEMCV